MLSLVSMVARLAGQVAIAAITVWLLLPVAPFFGVVPDLSPPRASDVELAMETLRRAERLNAAQVGYAGVAPVELLAWRIILRAPARDSLFLTLTRAPSRVAQLYGLIGLRVVDRARYADAAVRIRRDHSQVPTTIGCIAMDEPMPTLLSQIEQGVWSGEFQTGRLRR